MRDVTSLDQRRSGVLAHPTSLPGPLLSGDLGSSARGFIDWLAAHGQTYWQMLPLHPPSDGASPYQTTSTFAGHPSLVSIEDLHARGWVSDETLAGLANDGVRQLDLAHVTNARTHALREAFASFVRRGSAEEQSRFDAFCEAERAWLDDYALFSALKSISPGSWHDFAAPLRKREDAALRAAHREHSDAVRYAKFVEWCFSEQLAVLRDYAAERGVALFGDMPIFVAEDSAEVWANQHLFELDDDGRPEVVAGVPPDAFSETGQRWGNVLYRWPAHRADGYAWWIARLRHAFRSFDVVRIDHFIGFVRYWAIDAASDDARTGAYHRGPGLALFEAIHHALGELPLVAEDLGVLTDEVIRLRDELGFPGMKVLAFCFGSDAGSRKTERPHAWGKNVIAYTGTHDNDTIRGWLEDPRQAADHGAREERENARRYAGPSAEPAHRAMMRLVFASPANTAVVPLQDVLGLGTEARMNVPGTATGNWRWRARMDDFANDGGAFLKGLTEIYGRSPETL